MKSSLEKQIAYRQLTIKSDSSVIWLVVIRRILHKYNLPSALHLLDNPPNKKEWKIQIYKAIHTYWRVRIIENCASYQSLAYLNDECFQPGQVHHVLKICTHPTREASRMHVKLKLLTDTTILQS